MNKHHLVLVLATALTTVAVQAQTTAAPSAPALTVTATAAAVSQYMFRGQRLGGPSWEPAVELSAGPTTLGVWTNFPFKDKVPDTSDPEIDLYGSYNFTVSEVMSIAPGFTWYTYPQAPTHAGFYRTTFEPSVALNYTLAGVKLTPKLYYDVKLDGPTYEFTAAYAYPVKEIGSELDFVATVGTYYLREAVNHSNPATKAWGDYWLVGVSAPFQISKAGKLTVGYAYTEGRNAYGKQGTAPRYTNTLAVGRGVVTLAYSHAF